MPILVKRASQNEPTKKNKTTPATSIVVDDGNVLKVKTIHCGSGSELDRFYFLQSNMLK